METTPHIDIRENSINEAIIRNETELELCQDYKNDLVMATRNLQSFQNRLKVDVMVPVGKHALMPGYLYHTNEVMIGKPGGIFIESTTSQALDIVQRRMKAANERLKDLEVESEFYKNKLEYPQQKDVFSHEDQKEIIEEYNEEAEKRWRIAHRQKVKEAKLRERDQREKKTVSEEEFQAVMENLEELELLEELEEEFDEIIPPEPVDLSGQVAFKEKPRVSYDLESFSRDEEETRFSVSPTPMINEEMVPIAPPVDEDQPLIKDEKPKRKSLQFSAELENVKLIHKMDRPNTLIANYDPEYTLQLTFQHSPVEAREPPAQADTSIIQSPSDIYKKFAHCLKHWSAPTTPEDQPKSILKKTNYIIPVDRNAKLLSADDDQEESRRSGRNNNGTISSGGGGGNIYDQVVGDVLERNVSVPSDGSTQSTKSVRKPQGTEPKRVSRFKSDRS